MIEVPHTVAAVIEAIFFHSRLFFLSLLLLLLYLSLPSLLQLRSVTSPGLSFISHNALWWLRQCKHLTRRSSTTDWDQYRHFIRNIFFSLSLFPSVVSWHFSLFFFPPLCYPHCHFWEPLPLCTSCLLPLSCHLAVCGLFIVFFFQLPTLSLPQKMRAQEPWYTH